MNFGPLEPVHVFMLSLYAVIPVLLGRFLARGTWREIVNAYGAWIGLLVLLGGLQGGAHGEGFGWAILIAMFATVLAIPILVAVQKLWRKFGSTHSGRAR